MGYTPKRLQHANIFVRDATKSQEWYEDVFGLHTYDFDPGHAASHYNMAVLLESQGRMDAAADHYRSAVRSQPGYADAHCNLGVLLGKEGRLDEAAVELRRALSSEPTHAKASINLAVVLAKQGDVLGAERQLEDLLRIHPGFQPAQQALQQLRAQLH